MLYSLALIFVFGLFLGELFGKVRLPRFIGMILTGILLGPFVLNLISDEILNVSLELRKISLIVILLRAGLSLDISDLKKIGRPAVLMSFVPACFEIIAVVIFAPLLFHISYIEAAILGSVLAAVSPAVVVPKMINLINKEYGQERKVPQLVMAGSSVDDVFVIVLFTVFTSMYQTGDFHVTSILLVPVSIILGIVIGATVGKILHYLFKVFHVRDTIKVLVILAVSMLLVHLEEEISQIVEFSSLLSVMVLGITLLSSHKERANRLSEKFDKLWVFAELILFVLVGAAVDISVIKDAGLIALILLVVELLFRFVAVQLCLIKTKYKSKERRFIGISYLPKATVQAAIGGIPLALGIASGDLILAIAVLSIIVTAPLGAIGIDIFTDKLLTKGKEKNKKLENIGGEII